MAVFHFTVLFGGRDGEQRREPLRNLHAFSVKHSFIGLANEQKASNYTTLYGWL